MEDGALFVAKNREMAAATGAAAAGRIAMSTKHQLFPYSSSSSMHNQSKSKSNLRIKKKTNTQVFFVKSSSSDPNPTDKQNFTSSPEDVSYVSKLVGGSVAGAVVIKYGSILLPELTRPNLTQALIMICTPMLVSVLLLIKHTSAAKDTS